jgi:hypothetical protein
VRSPICRVCNGSMTRVRATADELLAPALLRLEAVACMSDGFFIDSAAALLPGAALLSVDGAAVALWDEGGALAAIAGVALTVTGCVNNQ